jgi:DNA-binding transcriptional LysR family regulator
LWVKPFVRNARSVSLTKAGARYLIEIQPHLAGLGRAAETARVTSGKLTGKVRAGFVSNLAYRVMPDLLKSLKKVVPSIGGVELSEMPGPEHSATTELVAGGLFVLGLSLTFVPLAE